MKAQRESATSGPRLVTRPRCVLAGSITIISALLGQPRALYYLFQELVFPRTLALVLGLCILAASRIRTSHWRWLWRLNRMVESGCAPQRHHLQLLIAWSCVLFAAAVGLAFTIWWEPKGVKSRAFLNSLRVEDGFWEMLTALCLFGAGLLLVRVALKSRADPGIPWGLTFFMGVSLLLGGGEEISWGQRLFGFETPSVLRGANVQAEANLHNLGNYWANYALMIGFFVYSGLLPVLERAFIDVRCAVARIGLPLPHAAVAVYGLIGSLLGDHPVLGLLWGESPWRLSEAREALFGLVMFGVALDRWLLSRDSSALTCR